jgi:hypothetical protein
VDPLTITLINGTPVKLVYNENILLPYRETKFAVKFGPELNNWQIRFVFTDQVPLDRQVASSNMTLEDKGLTIVLTYYAWYGNEIETNDFHFVQSSNGNAQIYIRLRTSASRSVDTRRAHVNIWQVI